MNNEKKNLKTWISRIVVAVALSSLLGGCGNHTDLEQRVVCQYNYKNDGEDYLISTKIWVRDGMGMSQSLPYWEVTTASTAKLDSVKNAELKKATDIETKIKKLYDL